MYVPKHFSESDPETLTGIVAAYGFATLVTDVDGAPSATHVPLLLEGNCAPGGRLVGHVARANPHWRSFDGRTALAIFHGPHGYVSPRWYATSPAVPTWNYAAVHAYGAPRVIDDPVWTSA